MRLFNAVALLGLALSSHLFAASVKIGDTVSNLCWTDETSSTVCLNDYKGDVRVLLYNGGFCGPCNREFASLVPQVKQFNKKPVTFISISSAGWDRFDLPTATFLKEWKNKHSIPFPVVGKHGDTGRQFFDRVGIPAVAIVNENQKLVWTATGPDVSEIIRQVKKLVGP